MRGEVINVPLQLLKRAAQTQTGIKTLTCAIMVSCRYVNRLVYNPTVAKFMDIFHVSKPTAIKYRKMIMGSCLFSYNKKNGTLYVNSFKSTEKRDFGRHFKSADDYCVKVPVDICDMKLGKAVKVLRKLLMKHLVSWNQRKESLNKHQFNCEAPAVGPKPMKLREFASYIGMSKSSSSRYMKEIVLKGEVHESEVVMEAVSFTDSRMTLEECRNKYPEDYVFSLPSYYYHGNWYWRILGRRYTLEDSEWSRFQHVIYDHKKRKSTIFGHTDHDPFDGTDYHDNFYGKGRIR